MSNQNLTDEQYWIAHANATRMERVGGGFHANLGKLFFRADRTNAAKLVHAFESDFLRNLPEEPKDETI